MTGYAPVDGFPPTVETSVPWLLEHGIGWDALQMITDRGPTVERDAAGKPVGVRLLMADHWWVVVLATPTGWSIGRYRGMVPFGWKHGVESDLSEHVQRAAAVGFAWPPTIEDP